MTMRRTIKLVAGIIITILPASAQSAEMVILERESAEAIRYYQQVEVQAKVMHQHERSAHKLKVAAEKAFKAALKRQCAYEALSKSEEQMVRHRVLVPEYAHVAYDYQASDKETTGRLK